MFMSYFRILLFNFPIMTTPFIEDDEDDELLLDDE